MTLWDLGGSGAIRLLFELLLGEGGGGRRLKPLSRKRNNKKDYGTANEGTLGPGSQGGARAASHEAGARNAQTSGVHCLT